ncbi:uncharacterized protein LOC106134438 [Amyelois transitella]|uniref:uncharacterized protein LOC106134438 n=1 Tax=Amyelois transitella TaxID=680683 RepID=UPI0029905E10|nr:uncharacterized protein LOC106134438 [Amyelois transitella]
MASTKALYMLILAGAVTAFPADEPSSGNTLAAEDLWKTGQDTTVLTRATKPEVTTYVAKEQPEVTLKCSLPSSYVVTSCVFQDPSGRAIAADGGSENRYIAFGAGAATNGEVASNECGLRITEPVTSDLGLWRCAVQTDQDVSYGFLTVLCPWAMQDPNVAASVVSEPTLTAHQNAISHMEGDSLTMSCSIQAAVRYCYFRRPNGMTHSVAPGVTSDEFEYVGLGLDAGECGIRFPRLQAPEAGHWPEGRWSCHVGLLDEAQPEQRANMQVDINPPIEVSQYVNDRGLTVEADVFQNQAVEYCRYVRIDGQGFTSANLPDSRYSSHEQRSRGHCSISVQSPTILEHHPWTVAAKVVGRDGEVLAVTSHTISGPAPDADDGSSNNYIWLWCTGILGGVLLICAGILFIPAKNRRNTIARANSWKNSFRSSIQKTPLPDDSGANNVARTTPPAQTA